VERPEAELEGIRQHINKPAPPGHEFLEPGLGVAGFADAVLGGDGVGAQEYSVRPHAF
jgi:hypothetical protein